MGIACKLHTSQQLQVQSRICFTSTSLPAINDTWLVKFEFPQSLWFGRLSTAQGLSNHPIDCHAWVW